MSFQRWRTLWLQKMPMCPKKQRKRQTQPIEEEKRSRATWELQDANRWAGGKGSGAPEDDKRVIGEVKKTGQQKQRTGIIEPDAEDSAEGNEGQPQHQDADDADHRASEQSAQQWSLILVQPTHCYRYIWWMIRCSTITRHERWSHCLYRCTAIGHSASPSALRILVEGRYLPPSQSMG